MHFILLNLVLLNVIKNNFHLVLFACFLYSLSINTEQTTESA